MKMYMIKNKEEIGVYGKLEGIWGKRERKDEASEQKLGLISMAFT